MRITEFKAGDVISLKNRYDCNFTVMKSDYLYVVPDIYSPDTFNNGGLDDIVAICSHDWKLVE